MRFPNPRHRIEDVQEQYVRDQHIERHLTSPPGLYREPYTNFPRNFTINVLQMAWNKVKARFFGG
ncbi:hypothetical protein D3C81_2072520 [compost metagenome]